MSDADKNSAQIREVARKALFDAALKAARYLEDVYTPLEDVDQPFSQRDAGKQYYNLAQERVDAALKLLDIAFSSDK